MAFKKRYCPIVTGAICDAAKAYLSSCKLFIIVLQYLIVPLQCVIETTTWGGAAHC